MINSKSSDKSFSPNNQNTNTNDSKTNVYFRLDEPKIVASFRCNESLWKSFKKQIKAQGLSICHVLEPMILGWLNGYVNISNTIRPLNIENFVVERAVKRVRRYAREVEDGGRFYCALNNESVPFESLPLKDCHSCLNEKCRSWVFERKGGSKRE